MIIEIQVSGKTEEEAISSALAQLGKDIDRQHCGGSKSEL